MWKIKKCCGEKKSEGWKRKSEASAFEVLSGKEKVK